MKYLKLFEAYKNSKVDELLDGISPEFWKMVRIANWDEAITNCKDMSLYGKKCQKYKDMPAGRIYITYTFEQVYEFNKEFDILYKRLWKYFFPYSDGQVKGFRDGYNVGDDSYWDLLSSVIGKGENWVIKCIKDPKLPAKMVKEDDYLENFQYMLNCHKQDYDRIKAWYIKIELKKYNL